MKAMFRVKPVLVEKVPNGYAVRYDLTENEDDDGTYWEAEEVVSPTVSYEDVVTALIHAKYSLDSEIALLNDHISAPEASTVEWQAYQAWRSWSKWYASETLCLSSRE